MENDYLFKFYDSKGNEIEPFFGNRLYKVTEDMMHYYAMGIVAGMYCKYKRPKVEVYRITESGTIIVGRIN